MSDQPLLVFNIEPATASMLRSMDEHERHRKPDRTSAIDPSRRHLNEVLVGVKDGPSPSLDRLYASGVQRPTAQAEAPYLRIVISASPSYFRPDDPEAVGTWDPERLEAWKKTTLEWLQEKFGADLVFSSLHLDEDTPHIHALVAPTYEKKPRRPGKKKRGETDEEFEARKAEALASAGVRTVGRASHPELSKKGSFTTLRKSLAVTFAPLGIEYGEDREPNAPEGMSTREWVRQETVRLRRVEAEAKAAHDAAAERAAELNIRAAKVEADEKVIAERTAALEIRAAKVEVRAERIAKAAKELEDIKREAIQDAAQATVEGIQAIIEDRLIPRASGEWTQDRALDMSRIAPFWSLIAPVLNRVSTWWETLRERVEALPEPKRDAFHASIRTQLPPEDPFEERSDGPGF